MKQIRMLYFTITIVISPFISSGLSAAPAEEMLTYVIKLKNESRERTFRVRSITKEKVVVVDESMQEIEYGMDEVEYMDVVADADRRFKKVIILLSRDYYVGHIIYQDRRTLTIKMEREMKNFAVHEIRDIVGVDDFISEMGKTRKRALIYSALYPGMGQLYTYNRRLSGLLFASTFAVALFSSVYFYNQSEHYYDRYEESRYRDTDSYDRHRLYRRICFASAAAAVGIYGWSLFDAYMNFQYRYRVNMRSGDFTVGALRRF